MKKIKIVILFTALVLFPLLTKAEAILISSTQKEVETTKEHEIKVAFYSNQQIPANGLEGKISLDLDLLNNLYIKDGNSAASLWIIKPELKINNNTGEINFSAINPSGINGYLFSIFYTAQEEGSVVLKSEGNALLSDGKGTQIKLENSNLVINIVKNTGEIKIAGNDLKVNNINIDKTPPEDFEIFVSKDEKLFNNKWFAVFNAQDKDSGIAFYEALESDSDLNTTKEKNWQKTTSPHLFKNQSPTNFLYIKAVDKNGNYKISVWTNTNPKDTNFMQNGKIYVIISIIVFFILAIFFEYYLRKQKKI